MADGDSTFSDALQTTRNLHRLIIATSVATIVFSLSLRLPEELWNQQKALEEFLNFNFLQYDDYVLSRVRKESAGQMKPVADNIKTAIESGNYPLIGLPDIWDVFEKPVLLGQAKMGDTKLAKPAELTLRELGSFADALPLTNDVFVAVPLAADLTGSLTSCLSDNSKMGMRVQSVRLDTADPASDAYLPKDGDTNKLTLSFELMPSGGPPIPNCNLTFDAKLLRVTDTSFSCWLLQNSLAVKFVSSHSGQLKWLPALDGIAKDIMDRKLGEVLAYLKDEARKGSPDNKTVSLLGAEIPGVLLIFATPLTLLALSYYLLFHLKHVCRYAALHKPDSERFAWMPLSMESGWLLESWFSLGLLPVSALGLLTMQLMRFHYLTWLAGIFTFVAIVAIAWLSRKSVNQIAELRGKIGKTSASSVFGTALNFFRELKGNQPPVEPKNVDLDTK